MKTRTNNGSTITNEQVEKYKPLVNKIIQQMLAKKLPLMYDDMLGYGYEGLMYAYNTFKPGTSQNFTQYAAWCIRNFIFTGMNEEGHLVKFNAYHQQKALETGENLVVKSITSFYNDDDDNVADKLGFLGVSEEYVHLENMADAVVKYVKENFSDRDYDIFVSVFGLGDEKIKGTELAAKYGVSSASITLITQKIIRSIRKNKSLMKNLENYIDL